MKQEQLGPYTLTWPEGVFPLGGDTLALGEFASVKRRWRVCDLGTGSGALLLLLARNRNIALYRETIYESVWGGEYEGQSRTIDLHVQRLKKKLGWNEEITAVYKVGYRLEGET